MSLTSLLRAQRQSSLVADAQLIASAEEGDERISLAEMLIREALVQKSLGGIDQQTEERIYSILAFAMPTPDFAPPSSGI